MKKFISYLCVFMALIMLGGCASQTTAVANTVFEQDSHEVMAQVSLQVPMLPYPPIHDWSVASRWASAHITRAHSLGLIPHSLFAASPTFTDYTIPTTRAEFAALAVALHDTIVFGGPTVRLEIEGVGIPGAMEFNDTDDINVRVMGYLGVVSGVGDGYFNPYGEITREQAAVMLVRLFNVIHTHVGTDWPVMLDLPHLPSVFTDYEQISPWAFNGVASAFGLKLMSGVGDRQFAPQSTFTREQSIVAVLRLFDMVNTELPNAQSALCRSHPFSFPLIAIKS